MLLLTGVTASSKKMVYIRTNDRYYGYIVTSNSDSTSTGELSMTDSASILLTPSGTLRVLVMSYTTPLTVSANIDRSRIELLSIPA